MRKKFLFGIFGVVVTGVLIMTFIGEETRDRFNPFIKEKDVFVLVKGEGIPDPDFPQRYMFRLNGVDESGETDEIKITTSVKNFPKESYLKAHVKGKYVYEYEVVSPENIPEKAMEVLTKQ
ncbi:YxeA family protein [Caldifermentibacillus hisashii]|uniref:YxeA family protein n=1 Tax=Caldifermentibacillus hisashii TaxID=996558 RepID=UPI003100BBA1